MKLTEKCVVLLLIALMSVSASAVMQPTMELLMENNITSTGTVNQAGWWYANEFIPGVDGTVGAGFSATSSGIAFGPTNGGTAMNDALSSGLDSFTIATWFKVDAFDNGTVFANTTTPNINGIHLYAGSAYPGAMLLRVDGQYKWGPSSLPYNTVGEWQFLAITYDGTSSVDNVKWYWADNGTLQSLTTSMTSGPVAASATAPIVIGGGNAGAITRLHGGVDDFRMWGNSVLSAADLAEVMNIHTSIPEPATLALLGLGAGAMLRKRK